MSYLEGIIRAAVEIEDAREATGSSSGDLGTIITSGSINKWAKFKPFRVNQIKIVPVVDDSGFPTKQTAVGTHYRYLIEANCGLRIADGFRNQPLQPIIAKVIAQLSAGNDDDVWVYQRPTGGSSQPFRLVDFCGYNANALPFMWQSNVSLKKVYYSRYGMGLDFNIEVFDSNNETIEGVIEPDDLADTLYNGDSLYYVAVICAPQIMGRPSDSSYIAAYSISSYPISSVNGRTASFTITKSGNNYVFNGTSSQHNFNSLKYKVLHMLARKDSSNTYTFLPMPYSGYYKPVTDLEIQSATADIDFLVDSLANYASNGSAVSGLTFQDINYDISINAWRGLTMKCALRNSGTTAVTLNLGTIYCETNCHSGAVARDAVYNSSYQAISDSVTIAANSSMNVYITFSGVFDITTLDGTDVEITFWGENAQGIPTINTLSYGGDGTIIYHTS